MQIFVTWITQQFKQQCGEGNGTNSSTLAWRIPWTEEPGRLQSMGSPRVGHDWATSFSLFTFMHWRRKWQPTPAFLPGESQGWGSLVGCHLWGRTELTRNWQVGSKMHMAMPTTRTYRTYKSRVFFGHDWIDLAAAAAASNNENNR